MTLASLKRHIDRRFAKLEGRFATKDDLRRFATKKDLKRFATKEDLERFATKEDLERFATKDEMQAGFREMHRLIESLSAKVDSRTKHLEEILTFHYTILNVHEERLKDLEARTGA